MYKVRSKHTELEEDDEIITERRPLTVGALYLFQVGSFLILGRWRPGWIIQPGRWIEIGHTAVKVIGHVSRLMI